MNELIVVFIFTALGLVLSQIIIWESGIFPAFASLGLQALVTIAIIMWQKARYELK